MNRRLRTGLLVLLLLLSGAVSWGCLSEAWIVLANAEFNTHRPMFHVTGLVGFLVWVPLPGAVFLSFRRNIAGGLILLAQWTYLMVYLLFWDFVLPTQFVYFNPAHKASAWGKTLILAFGGIALATYAIRLSKATSGATRRLRSYGGIASVAVAFCFAAAVFHYGTAGEDMHVASATYRAGRLRTNGDTAGGLRHLDSVLARYEGTPPTRDRIQALRCRAYLRRRAGDTDGANDDVARTRAITEADEDLASWLEWVIENERKAERRSR